MRRHIAGFSVFFLVALCPDSARSQTGPPPISFIQPLGTPLVSTRDGNGPVGLAAGDFDGDGIVDLAATVVDDLGIGQQGFIVVMRGTGDGGFEAPITLYTLPPNVFARGILAQDFDADGKVDLGVAVAETREILFFKDAGMPGTITFNAPIVTNTTHRPQGLQTADLNGDAKLDLVTLNPQDNTVSVLIGVGNGTFQAPTDYPAGSNPLDVAIGDVDGVNSPDLVVGSYDTSAVGVLLNSGNGTFGAFTGFNARLRPQGLYLADFDSDGKLDVVAAGNDCAAGTVSFDGCMVFMKGAGNGGFAVPSDQDFTGLDTHPIRRFTENSAPDLNGDGKPDVLFVPLQDGGLGNSNVAVGLNNGLGSGTFSVSYWVGAAPQPDPGANADFVAGLAAVPANFNGDNVMDVAYAMVGKDNTRGGVAILVGDTPGTFKVPRSYSTSAKNFDFGPAARGVVSGDFTGDGKVDVAVLAGSTDIFVTSPLIDVFPGTGNGSLGGPLTGAPWPPSGAQFHDTLRGADLDRNGTQDLVFFHVDQNLAQVASGNGNGAFTLLSTFGFAAGSPQNMVLADFNGDSYSDVAVFESVGCFFPNAQTNIEVLLQGAGGTLGFTSRSVTPVNGICGGGTAMVAADFDKDGKVDLVVPLGNNTNGTNASALFFKGNGDGTLQNATVVGTGLSTIVDYVAADVNEDSNLDLIGRGEGGVHVQLGNGNGSFQPPVAYDAGGGCGRCGVKVADFDGDGHLDLAVVGRDSHAGFAVLRGKGDGTFESPVKFAVGATTTVSLDIADVDGDSQPDAVIEHGGVNGNHYTVLINTTKPPSADVEIIKTGSPDPVTLGNNLTYSITVANNGPNAATGVTMTDPLPGTVTLVSATPSQGNCNGTTTVSCTLGTVVSGGSATVTIVVTPSQPGTLSNTATVAASQSDPNGANNSSTAGTVVNAAARQLSALSPALLWIGQNDATKQLKLDIMAEVLVNNTVVGAGQLANVSAGGSGFSQAALDTISLALNSVTNVPAGAALSIRASVRSSCSVRKGGNSGVARLWFNGQPIDSGKPPRRDAGSRFDATIGGTSSVYFLRSALALSTSAGTSREFVDAAVSTSTACPARTFAPFGTWTITLQ